MILKWTAAWYELDQTIIVGDKDWFYLPSNENNHSFFNELYQSNSFIRKKLEIDKISHPVLGDVKGIVAIGLDYTVYLADGTDLGPRAELNEGGTVVMKWSEEALSIDFQIYSSAFFWLR